MKAFTILFLSLSAIPALADPTYTLSEVCAHYTDSQNSCERIPFCDFVTQTEGCVNKPESPQMATTCPLVLPQLCAITIGCQKQEAGKWCVANRSEL
jgi:hypothetical protein